MAENSERKEYNLGLVNSLLKTIYVFDIDEATSTIYGRLKSDLMKRFAPKEKRQRRKTRIIDIGFDDNDLWIASIALQHNLTMVSSDSDFQRLQTVRDFSLETWYARQQEPDS